jgi:hypothetical protein
LRNHVNAASSSLATPRPLRYMRPSIA